MKQLKISSTGCILLPSLLLNLVLGVFFLSPENPMFGKKFTETDEICRHCFLPKFSDSDQYGRNINGDLPLLLCCKSSFYRVEEISSRYFILLIYITTILDHNYPLQISISLYLFLSFFSWIMSTDSRRDKIPTI